MKKQNMTFKEIYLQEKAKPTPAMAFIENIAKLTCRSRTTVIGWIAGVGTPDALTQKVIAEELNVDAASLFPTNTRQ